MGDASVLLFEIFSPLEALLCQYLEGVTPPLLLAPAILPSFLAASGSFLTVQVSLGRDEDGGDAESKRRPIAWTTHPHYPTGIYSSHPSKD